VFPLSAAPPQGKFIFFSFTGIKLTHYVDPFGVKPGIIWPKPRNDTQQDYFRV